MKLSIETVIRHGEYNPYNKQFQLAMGSSYVVVYARKISRAIQRLRTGYTHITALPDMYLERSDAAFLLANSSSIMAIIGE